MKNKLLTICLILFTFPSWGKGNNLYDLNVNGKIYKITSEGVYYNGKFKRIPILQDSFFCKIYSTFTYEISNGVWKHLLEEFPNWKNHLKKVRNEIGYLQCEAHKNSFSKYFVEKISMNNELFCKIFNSNYIYHWGGYRKKANIREEAKKRGLTCGLSILAPPNASISGNFWKCDKGYKKSVGICKKIIEIPENAFAFGDSWKCNDNYYPVYQKCEVIPDNSFFNGTTFQCFKNYFKKGNQCILEGPPLNAYAVGKYKWKCNKGYIKTFDSKGCQKLPQNKINNNKTTQFNFLDNNEEIKNFLEKALKFDGGSVSISSKDSINIFDDNQKLLKKEIVENTYVSKDPIKCKSGYEKVGDICKAKVSSEELIAAQKKAAELEQQLAVLQSQQQKQQQQISQDNQIPLIDILSSVSSGKQGIIKGRATDNVEVAEVTIDGKTISIDSNGYFEHTTYIREGGTTLTIEAFDMAGLSSMVNVSLERNDAIVSNAITFDPLNPLGKTVSQNNDALAFIIGIENYENTPLNAPYADSDAKVFRDYAIEKLGISEKRIKTLINNEADMSKILLNIRKWLRRLSVQNQSDIYVFYSGHGLQTSNGDAYLFPYDGSPELEIWDVTALSQKKLFEEIENANPKSVTIFLDACFTGQTRSGKMLIAGIKPVMVVPKSTLPENFTIFTSSSGAEFSQPLEEAKHGMFSYFLMKGMEGEADADNDNAITASELHAYVQKNVIQQSAGSQTPEMQGDANRVLVQFQ